MIQRWVCQSNPCKLVVEWVAMLVQSDYVQSLGSVISKHPELEFIIQRNEETKPFYEGLVTTGSDDCGSVGTLPSNVTTLVDQSKELGIRGKDWPSPPKGYDI